MYKSNKRKIQTPRIIIIETLSAGALSGIARVQWEKMNPSVISSGITPNYLNYAFMGAFVALALVLTLELNFASWTKRIGMSLVAGFFFQSMIASGHLEAQLIQQQHKTQTYIEEVAQVSIESNSPASHSRAIDTLEGIALDTSETIDGQEIAITGLAEVTEASNNFDVKHKAILSLVKIGIKSDSIEEKNEIIRKLREMDYPIPSSLHESAIQGIAKIEDSFN